SFLGVYVKDPKDPSQGFMFPDSPLMDAQVRKALNKALDRDGLNKAFFGGKGIPMYNNYFNENLPGWNPDWQTRFAQEYGYDPAAAKALLAQAGKSNVTLSTIIDLAQFPGGADLAETIAGAFKAIGVDAK